VVGGLKQKEIHHRSTESAGERRQKKKGKRQEMNVRREVFIGRLRQIHRRVAGKKNLVKLVKL
jgi:hypothetical protein